jgi:hypothetical protein
MPTRAYGHDGHRADPAGDDSLAGRWATGTDGFSIQDLVRQKFVN